MKNYGNIDIVERCGSLAQLGEHLPYKQGVIGSSPIVPTTNLKLEIVYMQTVDRDGDIFFLFVEIF